MIKIKNICYIVSACKESCRNLFVERKKNDFIIAADGGYDILREKKIEADVLIGDFDSIDQLPSHSNIIRYPSQKDDTDTFLAYKMGLEKGYRNFVIYGGIGGRIDHTIANIRTLSDISQNHGRGFLIGNDMIITSILNSKITFPPSCKGYISVFANGGNAEGISISGLKYNVKDITLTYSNSLGVSNEFIGERAEISVTNGDLLIVWYENAENFLKNIDSFTYKNKEL